MFQCIKEGNTYKNLVNGVWFGSTAGQCIPIHSPTDGSLVGNIQAMSKDEVDMVMASSKEAQRCWREVPINKRAEILHNAAAMLEENSSEIAKVLENEIAKDKSSAVSEIARTADFIRFTADEGKHLHGETMTGDSFPGGSKKKLTFVTRVPVGTVLAISPFNYPINLSASKIAPALVAGNTVVLKPPTQGSISALHLAEVFRQAGLPPGVLNTITGKGSEIGDYVVTHENIDFINFTGSTEVGKHIALMAGMVPMIMELGGKDAAIVLDDADLDDAACDIVSGAFSYSGQRCTAVKRVLVMESIADELTRKISSNVMKLKVGTPSEDADIIPLISSEAADFVQELVDDALSKGARLVTGNKRSGNLMHPTLFDCVTTDMRLAWEEPFGPVLPIMRVKSIDEAIRIANSSQYGLQSAVFTKNIDSAFYVANKLEVGAVQINGKTERGPDHFPFSGVKASGMGTQGIKYSIEAMSKPKALVFNLD